MPDLSIPPRHDRPGVPRGAPGRCVSSRRPLGVAVVGGLLFSQMLTLYVTPVVYVYMERFQEWLRGAFPRLRPRRREEIAAPRPAGASH